MIIRWGGASAQRHQGAVSILDVMPTLLQLAGAERAPGFGQSLVPQLLGEPGPRIRQRTVTTRGAALTGKHASFTRKSRFEEEHL